MTHRQFFALVFLILAANAQSPGWAIFCSLLAIAFYVVAIIEKDFTKLSRLASDKGEQ